MVDNRTRLSLGDRVLTDTGAAVVTAVRQDGVELRTAIGERVAVRWSELATARNIAAGEVASFGPVLRPAWDGLPGQVKRTALARLGIVQEVLTGYRDGHAELAVAGEPRPPFGEGFGLSETRRCEVMAQSLAAAGAWRGMSTIPPGASTIKNWVRSWRQGGLLALVDGRSLRKGLPWDSVDPRYREIAERVVGGLDGDRSTVSLAELDRRVRVELKKAGDGQVETPRRATNRYLAHLKADRGESTRSQRSRSLRRVSGNRHFSALRPGQVVAIDATRADNLVYDPLQDRPYSVEVLTAVDVATRVILALRVVPMSADGIDAGLLLYDVCRPFSLLVEGTTIGDWRWSGLPSTLDLADIAITAGRDKRRLSPDFSTLQGEHHVPSVLPDAVRCDHGSIFVSEHFRCLLRDFGIDLLLSRGKKPTDNPHVERWHETLQRAVQQIPGYKGRNTAERGLMVAHEPLLTAVELERHLRRFVALDYHRSWHTGLVIAGDPGARVSPLEMRDAMLEAAGRIDVPQRADLVYQFLPVKWGTIGHAGVEFANMVYDSPVLDEHRNAAVGQFRTEDRKVPFLVDPHDLSCIWFRDPTTNKVSKVPWRGAHLTDAPMTDVILSAVRSRIRERGGNQVLRPGSAAKQIIEELTEITAAPDTKEWKAKLSAGRRRVEQSREDHAEAQHAMTLVLGTAPEPGRTVKNNQKTDFFESPWPSVRAEGSG